MTAVFAAFPAGARGSVWPRACAAASSTTARFGQLTCHNPRPSTELPAVIPQTDPRAGYLAQRAAIDAAIARVLEGGSYILGREVEAFEAAFADFIGVAHAVACANGTDAIELALRACGIGSGHVVFPVSPPPPRSAPPTP